MKKVLSIMLALMLCIAALPVAALADSTKTVYISSTGEGTMHVRKGPGMDYGVKGYVHHGDKVTVKDTDGEWSKVKVKGSGTVGWIKTKYIDGTTKELGTGLKYVKIEGGGSVKLRKGPGTSYDSKGTVSDGKKVKVMNTEQDWVKISVGNGKTGWIPAKYIGGSASSGGSSSSSGKSGKSGGSSSSSSTQKVYHVTGASLNVRKGAGTSYGKAGTLSKGDGFRVTGSSGNWFKIKSFSGLTGWVSKNYAASGAQATVTASSLNLRKGAGSGTKLLGSLKNGTSVTVDSITGNWAHVTAGKQSGYVSMKYLAF